MKLPNRIIIVLFCAACIGVVGWSASHYHGKYQQEQKRADTAEHSLKPTFRTCFRNKCDHTVLQVYQ